MVNNLATSPSFIANSTACRHLAMTPLLVQSQTRNPPTCFQFHRGRFHGIDRLVSRSRRNQDFHALHARAIRINRRVRRRTTPTTACGSAQGPAFIDRGLKSDVAGCLATKASWRSLQGMSSSNWPCNRLLLALPARNLKQLMPELEQIRCQREQVLMDADSSLDHVFFPDSGVVSVVAVYPDGSIIEMATIGREGCAGVQAVFGAKSSSARLLVQIPGSAAKMSRAAFMRAMESMPSFRRLMFAYVQAFLEQVMVSGACNGAHSLKERLARWLLMMRDRGDDDALQITCLLYTSPSPRDRTRSRMPSS